MLQGRKEQIFFSIVESYIENGEPVGSKCLLSVLPGVVSSATIRNDMAYLTELGGKNPHLCWYPLLPR